MDLTRFQLQLLEKGLDAAWQKNEALAANIANADTPGYKAVRVSFESVFKNALENKSAVDVKSLEPEVYVDEKTSFRQDGNNVDLDQEMTEMAKNTLYYETLIYMAGKEISRIKLIATEGK